MQSQDAGGSSRTGSRLVRRGMHGGILRRRQMSLPDRPALHAVVIFLCAFSATGAHAATGQASTPARSSPSTPSRPATYEALVNRAKTQLANKQSHDAQSTAEQAIRLDGERYEAHIVVAAALRDQKQYAPAVTH